ncbi:hypothetical protein G6011_01058 [Alternaria panax]|uniref:Uncharacterized protein n=1 Tax=Alternaria panax TaxID=48097 RepID=A0AAD4NV96_9PLEO|nr:hypothetical protein G6011_01058 [Alternaria panax]
MSQTKANEPTHKQWLDTKRKEEAMMRLCDDMQAEVLVHHEKSQYWRAEYAFLETCGTSPQNLARMEEAWSAGESWLKKAVKRFCDLGKQTKKLKVVTATRKELQEQLGLAATEDGYIAYGDRGNGVSRCICFVLLDHELDSTTSVRHYIAENMGGSSLFANEEWRPLVQ